MRDFTEQNDPAWYLRLVKLAEDPGAQSMWAADELAQLWHHQLEANVPKCVEELSLVHALHCQTLCAGAVPPIKSLRDLFLRHAPDVQVLAMVAKWMERALGDPEELLPREVALSLFNVSIVLARVRCATKLINGSDTELARRADWVAARSWMDAGTAEQMRLASRELGGIDSLEGR